MDSCFPSFHGVASPFVVSPISPSSHYFTCRNVLFHKISIPPRQGFWFPPPPPNSFLWKYQLSFVRLSFPPTPPPPPISEFPMTLCGDRYFTKLNNAAFLLSLHFYRLPPLTSFPPPVPLTDVLVCCVEAALKYFSCFVSLSMPLITTRPGMKASSYLSQVQYHQTLNLSGRLSPKCATLQSLSLGTSILNHQTVLEQLCTRALSVIAAEEISKTGLPRSKGQY